MWTLRTAPKGQRRSAVKAFLLCSLVFPFLSRNFWRLVKQAVVICKYQVQYKSTCRRENALFRIHVIILFMITHRALETKPVDYYRISAEEHSVRRKGYFKWPWNCQEYLSCTTHFLQGLRHKVPFWMPTACFLCFSAGRVDRKLFYTPLVGIH